MGIFLTHTVEESQPLLFCDGVLNRVPMPPGKSWNFFLQNSRTWKVLKKHFGPGKSWKNILENYAFLSVLMERKTNIVSKCPSMC